MLKLHQVCWFSHVAQYVCCTVLLQTIFSTLLCTSMLYTVLCYIFVLRQLRLVFLNFKLFGKLEGWKLSFTKQPVWKSYCGYKLNRSPGTRLKWRVWWQRKMWANKKTTCDKTTCLKFKSEFLYVSIVIHKQLNYLCHVLSPPKQVSNVIKKWPAKWDHEDSMAKADCLVLFEIVSPAHTWRVHHAVLPCDNFLQLRDKKHIDPWSMLGEWIII